MTLQTAVRRRVVELKLLVLETMVEQDRATRCRPPNSRQKRQIGRWRLCAVRQWLAAVSAAPLVAHLFLYVSSLADHLLNRQQRRWCGPNVRVSRNRSHSRLRSLVRQPTTAKQFHTHSQSIFCINQCRQAPQKRRKRTMRKIGAQGQSLWLCSFEFAPFQDGRQHRFWPGHVSPRTGGRDHCWRFDLKERSSNVESVLLEWPCAHDAGARFV